MWERFKHFLSASFVVLVLGLVVRVESAVEGLDYVEGELLVALGSECVEGEWLQLGQENGFSVKRFLSSDRKLALLKIEEGIRLESVYRALERRRGVEAVSYNFIRKATLTPDDPYLGWEALWGHANVGHFSGVVGADVDSLAAWDTLNDAGGIVVAVLDTGVRYTHEDLAGNMWTNSAEIPGNGIDDDGNNYVDDVYGINATNGTGDPMDDMGHGTHVAGILGAVGNNSLGVVGVAWNVQIMALKFLDSGGDGTDADAIECIEYAIANGADIINNSWGGGTYNAVLERAISSANDAGIFFVAAAGNANVNIDDLPNYPASYELPNIVSVAATNRSDELADFSSFGESSVDIAAPGDGIYSTYIGSDSDYRTLNGSSMAAPFVSGALALVLTQFPGEEMATILNRLYSSAEPLPSLARRCRTGARLNVKRALQADLLPPLNDSFDNPILLTQSSVQSASFNSTASLETNEPVHHASATGKSVWWRWTAPSTELVKVSTTGSDFLSLLVVYEGEAIGSLSLVTSDVDSASPVGGASVSFSAESGKDYYIAVDGVSGAAGNVSLTVSQTVANDDFESAATLGASGESSLVNNGAATSQTGEPSILGREPEKTLWWNWVASYSGEVAVATSGSNSLDTLLAVYTGDSLDALSLVVADHDSGPGFSSLAVFEAIEGVTYRIAVDSWSGEIGDVSLNVLRGENDAFIAYRDVSGASVRDFAYNGSSSKEVGELDHVGNVGGRSLWWRWQSTRAGQATLSTFGSDFDTLLAVYNGSHLLDLEAVASNDDSGGGLASQVTIDVEVDDVFYVAVDGRSGFSEAVTGKVVLNIDVSDDPSGVAPRVGTQVLADGTVGSRYSRFVELVGAGAWASVTGLPDGILFDLSTGELSGAPTASGAFDVGFVATNGGSESRTILTLNVLPSVSSPSVALDVERYFAIEGDSLVLSPEVSGNGDLSYQWFKDGELIVGARSRELSLVDVASDAAGEYNLVVTSEYGSVVSMGINIFVDYDTLAKLSTRGHAKVGDEVMISGFVVSGESPRRVLIRAVGPSLASSELADVLEDPRFTVFSGGEEIASSDNWRQETQVSEIETVSTALGAFALSSENESALVRSFAPGAYTVVTSAASGAGGIALTEVYDVDRGIAGGSRLVNISTRVFASDGIDIPVVGFVIDGEESKKVLIRALGPGLETGDRDVLPRETILPDPFMMLYSGDTLIKANDDWFEGGGLELESIFSAVGTSVLDRASFDSAMAITLPPGAYIVNVVDLSGVDGVALVEVFELD